MIISFKFLKDALNDENAIVAKLGDINSNDGHCVMIYDADNKSFKVKDSNGNLYSIPIKRPDFFQVDLCLLQFMTVVNTEVM